MVNLCRSYSISNSISNKLWITMPVIFQTNFLFLFSLSFTYAHCANQFVHLQNFVVYFHGDLFPIVGHNKGKFPQQYVFSQTYNVPLIGSRRLNRASQLTNYIFLLAYNKHGKIMCTEPALNTFWTFLRTADTLVFLVNKKQSETPSGDHFCFEKFINRRISFCYQRSFFLKTQALKIQLVFSQEKKIQQIKVVCETACSRTWQQQG